MRFNKYRERIPHFLNILGASVRIRLNVFSLEGPVQEACEGEIYVGAEVLMEGAPKFG